MVQEHKVKIDENKRVKTFNRLIDDAKRRIDHKDKDKEKDKEKDKDKEITNVLNSESNINKKKYKKEEWEEIYASRYVFLKI